MIRKIRNSMLDILISVSRNHNKWMLSWRKRVIRWMKTDEDGNIIA